MTPPNMYTQGAYYSGNNFPPNLYGSPKGTFDMADNMLGQIKTATPSGLPMSYTGANNGFYNYGGGYGYPSYGFFGNAMGGLYAGSLMFGRFFGGMEAAKIRNQTNFQGQMMQIAGLQQQDDYTAQIQSQQNLMSTLQTILMMRATGMFDATKPKSS